MKNNLKYYSWKPHCKYFDGVYPSRSIRYIHFIKVVNIAY